MSMVGKLACAAISAAFISLGANIAFAQGGEKVFRLGFIGPMTGPFADLGARPTNTLKMAIESLNAEGGVALKDGTKAKIELATVDDRGQVDVGGTEMRRLIESDKVDAVLGGMLSSVALAEMDIAENLQTPFMIVGAIASQIGDRISKQDYRYVFQATPTSTQRATADIQAINDLLAPKRIYLISQDTDWGRDMTHVAADVYRQLGDGYQFAEEYVSPGNTDYSSLLLKIQAFNPDVIYASLIGQEIFSFMEQKSDSGISAFVYGSSSTPSSNIYIKTLGEDVSNGTLTNLVWAPKVGGELAADFSAAYSERFGSSPSDLEAQAYDGFLLLLDAVSKADGLSHEAIADALLEAKIDGLRGPGQAFDAERHGIPGLSFVIGQVQDGGYTILWPSEHADGELARP